jgi:hypothetical protein
MTSNEQAVGAGRRAALFIGHPGHELRVFGWMQAVRPKAYVLTDGSGSSGQSRLHQTTRILGSAGAGAGCVYGRLTDQQIYQAMMEGEISRFIRLADELASAWTEDGVDLVASDGNEGYSPTHDVCCEIAHAATEMVRNVTGRRIVHYGFYLTEWESDQCPELTQERKCFRLSDEARDAKIAAARSYTELRDEVERALDLKGPEYFRNEYLYPVSGFNDRDADDKPSYEKYGEQRVAAGTYSFVLRYREHVLPIFAALRNHAVSRESPVMRARA